MNNPGLESQIADTGRVAQEALHPAFRDSHEETTVTSTHSHDDDGGASEKGSSHSPTRWTHPRWAGRKDRTEKHNRRHKFVAHRHGDGMHWWMLSTAFPLVAGTFGPVANLMSVCALVNTWRVQIPPGGVAIHGTRIADPAWLIAVNIVSLVIAIVANLVLLLNFAHRIRYKFAQPVVVVGWFISSFLLIGIVIATATRLRLAPLKDHALSQSYYYAIISAVLYAVISSLLAANMAGAYVFGAYPPSFTTLTIPQRTLMLQTISYTVYLGVGALIFSKIEQWDYVDGVYWANYTLLTVGLGTDFPLRTHLAKALLMPFAVGGITMLGLVIGSIRSLVLDRGKKKVRRRALEKQRKKAIRRAQSTPEHSWHRAEFEKMREVQTRADALRKYWSLGLSVAAFLLVWLGGAMVFTFSERAQSWTYFQALYFSYTTLLTIGYGDYYPQSNSGKPFFVIWSLLAVPTMTILISNMGDTVIDWVREATLWLGERTILPESRFHLAPLRRLRLSPRQLKKEEHAKFPEAPRDGAVPRTGKTASKDVEHTAEHGAGALQNKEGAEARAEHESGIPTGEVDAERGDIAHAVSSNDKSGHGHKHAQASIIVREIKSLAADLGISPPKRYRWEEWRRWMQLVGDEHTEQEGEWSWLGEGGPLLGGTTETEWILHRLCERLEEIVSERDNADGEDGHRREGEGSNEKEQ